MLQEATGQPIQGTLSSRGSSLWTDKIIQGAYKSLISNTSTLEHQLMQLHTILTQKKTWCKAVILPPRPQIATKDNWKRERNSVWGASAILAEKTFHRAESARAVTGRRCPHNEVFVWPEKMGVSGQFPWSSLDIRTRWTQGLERAKAPQLTQ